LGTKLQINQGYKLHFALLYVLNMADILSYRHR